MIPPPGVGPPKKEAARPEGRATTTPPSAESESSNFQPMPELSAEQLDALREDIAANGVLVPVVKDQHGRILDGNHRAGIATELGIDYPVIVVEVADDTDAMNRAVSLNCTRRHLTREQVRVIIASEIGRSPDDSDRAIARRVGCSPTTVGTVRADKRREAEELTERIRDALSIIREQISVEAFLLHHEGNNWQRVGMAMEHDFRKELSKLDTAVADDEVFGPMFGPMFDSMRAYDCHENDRPHCGVCNAHYRQWRDDHPGHVYRWTGSPEVSNLDTERAGVTR